MNTPIHLPTPSRLATFDRAFRLEEFEVQSKLARLIASSQGVSRADLARNTGFARSTVSQLIQPLIECDLVKEQTQSASARGRPGTMLVLNSRAGLILVADMGATHGRLVISDLAQRRLAERVFSIDVSLGPEMVLDSIVDQFQQLLREHRLLDQSVRSVVVGLPSPVDFSRGVCVRPPIMPGWDGFQVSEYLQSRLKTPVLVDNDVNLMALGEARTRPAHQSPLLFAKVSTGIGCGIITSDGMLHRGADGSAGDIGHIRVPGRDDVICRCGNIGCVEAVASTNAVLANLQALPEAGAKNVVHMYNPAAIVLGGRMARISDDLLAGVRAVVYRRALPLATRSLLIENTALNQYAGAIGGAVLGIESALSSKGIASILHSVSSST
jgi:predicted NBD/HSP70 family sugar kinase